PQAAAYSPGLPVRTVLIAVAGFAAGLMIALFFRQAAPQQAFTPDPLSPKRRPSATLTGALSTDDVDESWDMGLRAPLAQTRLPAGADCEEAYRWAQRHGAVPLGDHEIDLRVEAHRDVAVRLLRIEVREVTDKSGLYL